MAKKAKPESQVINVGQLDVANSDIQQVGLEHLIYVFRGKQVMLDRDIAMLYSVETGQLNRQVKRNLERFPSDFMFQLSKEEVEILKCQNGISSWGGDRYLPYAFTENGIAMLSSVLRSPTAIEANIRIMRAFTSMRHFLASNAQIFQRLSNIEYHQVETDKRIDEVFRRIDAQTPPQQEFNKAHDRFLLIDEKVYHIGASIKDLGKKWFAFTLMRDITAKELIKKIK